jgi:hypothetical protein
VPILVRSFPEMLPVQIPFLVDELKEESKEGAEGATRKRLRNKIASLSQQRAKYVMEALGMIWDSMKGPLRSSLPHSRFRPSATLAPFPKFHRVQLALLKAITTGVFIDVQLYAYNKTSDCLPLDPKPLFASSVVIEGWMPAIATMRQS